MTSDWERSLREASAVRPPIPPSLDSIFDQAQSRDNQRQRQWTVGIVLLATSLVLNGLWITQGGRGSNLATSADLLGRSPTPTSERVFKTETKSPLASRESPVVIAGAQNGIYVWGGEIEQGGPVQVFNDGAVFHSEEREWVDLGSPDWMPLSGDRAVGAADAERFVVYRGQQGAAWQTQDERWVEISSAPLPVTDLFSTGSTMVSVSASSRYDPSSDSWIPFAIPALFDPASARATSGDDQVLLVDARWSVLSIDDATVEVLSESEQPCDCSPHSTAWVDEVLYVSSGSRLWLWDDQSGWQRGPSVPISGLAGMPSLHVVSGEILAVTGEAIAILQGDRWWVVPSDGAKVAIGHLGHGWGYDGETGSLTSFTSHNVIAHREILIGGWRLRLAPDEEASFSVVNTHESLGNEIELSLSSTSGACTVVSYPVVSDPPDGSASLLDLSESALDLGISCDSLGSERALLQRFLATDQHPEFKDATALIRSILGLDSEAVTPVSKVMIRLDGRNVLEGEIAIANGSWRISGLNVADLVDPANFTLIPGLGCERNVDARVFDSISAVVVGDLDPCSRPRITVSVDSSMAVTAVDIETGHNES